MSKGIYTPWDSAQVLDDDTVIIEYLQAALEENDPELFVKAVENAARAVGMTTVAQETELRRTSLYKALSGERDLRIGTVMRVLGALCRGSQAYGELSRSPASCFAAQNGGACPTRPLICRSVR